LELIASLAREVRQELGPLFESQVLSAYLSLADNPEHYDQLFTRLSLTLKHVVNRIDPLRVVKASLPLIMPKDPIVRHMAAQCYAFLLRKAGQGAVAELLTCQDVCCGRLSDRL
jgi:alanine dehydrogenase